jgi:hypothetical protein
MMARRTRKIKEGEKYKERRDGPVHIPIFVSFQKRKWQKTLLRTVVIYKTFETRIKHVMMPTNINFVNHLTGTAVNNGYPSPYSKAHMNDQLHLHKTDKFIEVFSHFLQLIFLVLLYHATIYQYIQKE